MGACMSVHGNKAKLFKRVRIKKLSSKNTNNNSRSTTTSASAPPKPPWQLRRRQITVLTEPSGEDIHKKYEFGKELGRGEFGITYRCLDKETGEAVACKKISKCKLRTEIDVQDVRREVEIARKLPRHPHIVSFKDEAYEDEEAVYLVMELCEGGELFDRIISKGHYTERAAALVTKTILEVVQVCHKHGVIHRDLKPENFLYSNSSETAALKSIDFGLSIFYHPGQRFSEIVGSPYYMAPEVLRRNYGAEVDIWSAGVILYILLCGLPPFWAETEEGIAHAIVRGEIDFNREPWPKVSEDAKDLVKGMLQQDPSKRLTVQQVLENRWIQNANNKVPNVPLGDVQTRIKQFTLMNKFKKKVIRVVADNLSDEQVHGIKEMFDMMDKDKNGCLTFEELKDGLVMIGQPVHDPDVHLLIDAADADGNGMLSCEEFVMLAVYITKISKEDLFRDAFRFFDKNGSGYIEFEELKESLFDEQLGSKNDQVVHDIIFDADLDKDGRISYQEFKAMMKTGIDWKMGSRQYSRVKLNALSSKMFNGKSGPLK